MNVTTNSPSRRRGFTLVEMIGVLAVIAVLAGLLIPRVFSAIAQSRINATALGYNSLKSASLLYFGKYGKFGGPGGTLITDYSTAPAKNWDTVVLLPEGFIEKPFDSQLGTLTVVQVVQSNTNAPVLAAADGTYNLANAADNLNSAIGGSVIEAVMDNVSPDDAKELNDRIDGANPVIAVGSDDTQGRVKYDSATKQVHLYIAHK